MARQQTKRVAKGSQGQEVGGERLAGGGFNPMPKCMRTTCVGARVHLRHA